MGAGIMSGWLLDMRPRGAGGGSSGAPVDATYITQTPNATLTNEQALSLLATGLLKSTTGTGVLSIAVPTVDYASAAQGALADASLQPGDIGATVQAWDTDLDTLAGLAKTKGNLIAGDGANWQALPVGANGFALVADSVEATGLKWAAIVAGVSSVFGRTGAVVAVAGDYTAALVTNVPAGGIAAATVQAAINELDTKKQPISANLTTLAALAHADGNIIVSDGAAWVVESGATARTSLGLGTIATQNANNVTISGGSVTGITDLAIADGGTGQSTAQAAINALTTVSGATNEHVLTKDTATGNAIFKAAAGGSSLPVADTQTIVMGSVDNTKLLRFEVDSFTAGTTRVLTPPNADATIAGLEVANVFTVGQTIQGTTALTLSTANSKITGATSLTLEETGDTFGTVQLSLRNRNGANGALFSNLGLNLVDFGFKPNTAPQMNLRFEGRSGSMINSTNSAKGELQVLLDSLTGVGTFSAGFGQVVTQFNVTDKVVVASETALTNTIQSVLDIRHNTSNSTPVAGFGPGILFRGDVSGSVSLRDFGQFAMVWNDAANGSQSADFVFQSIHGAGSLTERMRITSQARVGINDSTPDGQLDVVQSSTTAAIPTLKLEQADLSEEFIRFDTTVGTGNPTEAVGAKVLTTTHFIRVHIEGVGARYIPVGTIA